MIEYFGSHKAFLLTAELSREIGWQGRLVWGAFSKGYLGVPSKAARQNIDLAVISSITRKKVPGSDLQT